MSNEENQSLQRLKLLKTCTKKDLSYDMLAQMTKYMRGKPESIKEQIAEKILTIIETSENEEEMLKRAKAELE